MPARHNTMLHLLPCLSARIFYILLLLTASIPAQADDGTLTVSINSQAPFSSQRPCGGGCIYNSETSLLAAAAINIEYRCTTNGCYCATQSQSLYSAFVTSCWSYACYNLKLGDPFSTIPIDISYALSVYNGYCATAYPRNALATTSAIVSSTQISSPGSSPVATSSLPPTTTTASVTSSSAAAQSGLSPVTIGGIAGGVAGAIMVGVLIGILFILCLRIRKKKRAAQNEISPNVLPQQLRDGFFEKAELVASPSRASEFAGNYQVRQEASHLLNVSNHHLPAGYQKVNTLVGSRIVNPLELDGAGYKTAELA